MHQNEKIQNALKLCDKLSQLETMLWNRFAHEFLTLLQQQDRENPSIDDQKADWPF
jgi:hypothetical protein